MKLILRKNDSATSTLLFIYNNYLALKNKDTLRLTSLIEIMKAFGKNETAVRMSLSRATKAKIFKSIREGNEVSYTLTNQGKEAIRIWNEGVKNFWERYQRSKEDWDGKWYVLYIDYSCCSSV
jgi:phenylacetic acid degradation operon negative regulatory protein